MTTEIPVTAWDGTRTVRLGVLHLTDDQLAVIEDVEATFSLSPTFQVIAEHWDGARQQVRRKLKLMSFDVMIDPSVPYTTHGEPDPF